MKKYLISLSRLGKQSLVLLTDTFSIVLSVWLSYSIRLDQLHFPIGAEYLVYIFPLAFGVPIFVGMGLYRVVFRYAGQYANWSIAKAVFFYALIFSPLIIFWEYLPLPKGDALIPRSLIILQPIILLVLLILTRSLAKRLLTENNRKDKNILQRILIYGAGDAGCQIRNSLQGRGQYLVVGFIDDDFQLRHKTISGLTIYGVDEIQFLISEYGVTDILLALPSIPQSRRNEILNDLRKFHVHVRSLPSITHLAEGKVKVSDILELDTADLLGRNSVEPNKELFEKNIKNQVVMVTGAGGSIGSELTRQILFSRPKTLILLEQSEFALYNLDAELRARIERENLNIELVSLLGNVRHYDWVKKIYTAWQINTVYHAAAYKHVPIVEKNIVEGVLNNVWGTLNAARAAIETGVNQFILISTDKAVRPTNVMGASKRLAELVLQALANQTGVQTQLSMVRFGNVLGSSGSVVPLFRFQIQAGGPVTVTHPEVTRYFMTIPEAAQLVIQAGAMASISGPKGQGAVFVLDMGEPVKIINLAQRMIELSGFSLKNEQNSHGDIAIEIIGLRPGEKLFEELLIGDNPMPTDHPRIMKAQEAFMVWSELEEELVKLNASLNSVDVLAIYEQLKNLIDGFLPDMEIVDWIAKTK